MTEVDVDKLIQRTKELRKLPKARFNPYRDMMIGDIVNGPARKNCTRMGNAAGLHRAGKSDDVRGVSWRGYVSDGRHQSAGI